MKQEASFQSVAVGSARIDAQLQTQLPPRDLLTRDLVPREPTPRPSATDQCRPPQSQNQALVQKQGGLSVVEVARSEAQPIRSKHCWTDQKIARKLVWRGESFDMFACVPGVTWWLSLSSRPLTCTCLRAP